MISIVKSIKKESLSIKFSFLNSARERENRDSNNERKQRDKNVKTNDISKPSRSLEIHANFWSFRKNQIR